MPDGPQEKKIIITRHEIKKFYQEIETTMERTDYILQDHYVGYNMLDSYSLRCTCELIVNNTILKEYLDILLNQGGEKSRYEISAKSVLKLSEIVLATARIKTDLLFKNISLDVQ